MSMDMTKQAIHDKLASQVTAAEAQLRALKADAEAKMESVEIKREKDKAIADLTAKKEAIQQKLSELKESGDDHFEKLKQDLQGRVTDFEKGVKTLESKIKQSRAA